MKELYDLFKNEILQKLLELGLPVTKSIVDIFFPIAAVIFTYILFPIFRYLKTIFLLKRSTLNNNPYYLRAEIGKALKHYVPTKFQNIPPSIEQEPLNTHAITAQQKLMPFFLGVFKKPEHNNKYYIILADSGMGKTTFLLNLFYSYKVQFFKKFDIHLFPLSQPNIEEDIKSIPDDIKCNSIILLDALDEDGKSVDNYVSRIDDLMTLTIKFRFVILTCRTQFFPFEEAEPSEIGIMKHGVDGEFHRFKKIYLSPFNDLDIKIYLWKKYPIWKFLKIIRAYRIVKASPYLMVRPMLLSYIDDLIHSKKVLNNIYEIYNYLVNAWIKREVSRKKTSERKIFESDLRNFSEKIALQIYNNFQSISTLSISGHQISDFAKENKINISDLELKSKSLLNRDANGNYKFAHKSILEYFLAKKAFNQFEFLKTFNFKSFTYAKRLYKGLCNQKMVEKDLFQYYGVRKDHFNKPVKITIKNPDVDVIQSLCAFPKILSLTISGLKLSNDYLHYLKMIEDVEELNISHNVFSDLSSLRDFESMKILDVSNNKLSIVSLEPFKSLEKCNLSNNNISEILIESGNLQELNISNNPLIKISISAKKIQLLNLINTKLETLPPLDKNVRILRNNDFNMLLNQAERLIVERKFGDINLTSSDSGIFNKCKVSSTFCEYIYDPKISQQMEAEFEYIDGLNLSKARLIKEILSPIPKSAMCPDFAKLDEVTFLQFINAGESFDLQNSYFKSFQLRNNYGSIQLKLIR